MTTMDFYLSVRDSYPSPSSVMTVCSHDGLQATCMTSAFTYNAVKYSVGGYNHRHPPKLWYIAFWSRGISSFMDMVRSCGMNLVSRVSLFCSYMKYMYQSFTPRTKRMLANGCHKRTVSIRLSFRMSEHI